ncbi:MAG: hypothetical protein ACLQNE_04520 [Thermoguttaceae bacterium]
MKYLSAFISFIFVFAAVFFVAGWFLMPPAHVFELEYWKDHWIAYLLGAVFGGLSARSVLRKEPKHERDKKDMQEASYKPPERSHNRTWLRSLLHYAWYRGLRASIGTALVTVALDAVLNGTYTLSLIVCPIWFLLSIANSASKRPGWKLALLRITIPVLTLGLVLTNDAVQSKIAEANAAKIVKACEEFHAANRKYPKTLGELVPKYMSSVPHAKCCLAFGQFLYSDEPPVLMWYVVPPWGREVYNFEKRSWSYID